MLLPNLYLVDLNAVLEPPLLFSNFDIVPTHHPLPHPAVLRERPIFQAIAALPLHPVLFVLVLIPELNRDPAVLESEKFFAETVVLLLLPLGGQEGDNFIMALEEGGAVAPDAVFGVGFGYVSWISRLSVRGIWLHLGGAEHFVFQRSWAFLTFA